MYIPAVYYGVDPLVGGRNRVCLPTLVSLLLGFWQFRDRHSGSRDPQLVVDQLVDITSSIRKQFGQLDSIGVGLPGMFNEAEGTPTLLPNFPLSWRGYRFRQAVEETWPGDHPGK